jgi:SAM-dependent methyltransferase
MILDFNDLVHQERTRLVGKLPKGARTVCSAGCAGRWYFDWFESQYGPVDLHYGVELFLEEPEDLPEHVVWIRNSVSDMRDVPTGSVDLLFSGQNIEHLYYEDLVGFLTESSRVLRPGGYLCIDSPNRLITQELGYIQPQHVLELTGEDVARLVESAGFEVASMNGIWSCVENGRRYDDVTTIGDDAEKRLKGALNRPDDAFIWWLVAHRRADADPVKVEQSVEKVIANKFAPFVGARFRKRIGTIECIEGTHTILRVAETEHGCVFFGPYVPLKEGRYVAEFLVKFLSDKGALSISVTSDVGRNVLASRVVHAINLHRWSSLELEFDLPSFTEGIETPLLTHGASALLRFGSQVLRQ